MKAKKILSGALALALTASLLAACSSGDTAKTTTAGTTTAAPEETTAADETTAAQTEGSTYPITITHAYGQTVIESEPQRVVTISWSNQDVPLALGIVPVGVSQANFGVVDENGLLPWTAQAYSDLGETNPVTFNDTDGLDFEAISDANPDVILAAYSGITQEDYDLLSQIAPVVAYPNYAWQTYWQETTLLNAQALGKAEEGAALVAETENLIAEKSASYEALQGKSAVFIYFVPSDLGMFYIYLPTDPRAAYLQELGFEFPQSILDAADDPTGFAITVSAENADLLDDVDIIVAYGDDTLLPLLQADPLLGQIPVIANGALVALDTNTSFVASTSPTILSIPATIDEYLGMLNAAALKVTE